MGGSSIAFEEGINNTCNDNVLDNISIPIPPKNLSLCLPLATDAKSLWLHFWYCLVGNRSQFDCIFCSFTCKNASKLPSISFVFILMTDFISRK